MTQKIKPRHPEKVKNPVNPIKKKLFSTYISFTNYIFFL